MNVCSFEQIILIVIKEEYDVSERNKTFDLTVRFNRGVDKTELHPEHLKVQFLLTGSTQSSSTVSPGQGGPTIGLYVPEIQETTTVLSSKGEMSPPSCPWANWPRRRVRQMVAYSVH